MILIFITSVKQFVPELNVFSQQFVCFKLSTLYVSRFRISVDEDDVSVNQFEQTLLI